MTILSELLFFVFFLIINLFMQEMRQKILTHALTGVLTFYPTRQIFLPGVTAHAHINISSFFSRWTTIFNASALL